MHLLSLASAHHVGWISPRLELPPPLIDDPESAAKLAGTEVVLECEARKIYRMWLPVDGRNECCFLYIFGNRSLGRALRPNYAFRVMRMSQCLRKEGFETLHVLAAFRPRRQFLNWRSYVVAQELRPVLELPSGGRHRYPVHESVALNPDVLSAVANTLASFHDRGFVHGDLKTRHVLAHLNGDQPGARFPWEIILVDLEKTRRFPRVLARAHDLFAARDLVQLCASLPEDDQGRSLNGVKNELITRYLEFRRLPGSRSRLIRAVVDLYRPGGRLRQGRTLLRSLLEMLASR